MREQMICTYRLKLLSPPLAALLASLAGQGYCWGQPVALNNPRWVRTGKLNTAREYHAATLLADGRVLVTGGAAWVQFMGFGAVGGCFSSAEIFDPATGTWRPTGSLSIARSNHTATLLPAGQVLVTGGAICSGALFVGATTRGELYDPAAGTWRNTGSLITTRTDHTATLLADGRVLVVGGSDFRGNDLRSAELYDPATERWSSTGAPTTVSAWHTTALLPDGKVLASGSRTCANIAELYDPATGRWSPTTSFPTLGDARIFRGCGDSSTLLPNSQVLVVLSGKTQLYDPATGEWSTATPLPSVGSAHTATLLPNGQVLAAGGWAGDFSVGGTALFDPANGTWESTAALNRSRAGHTATRLHNGKVLVAGGVDGYCCDARDTLDAAELFDLGLPDSGTVTSVSAASYRGMGLAPGGLAAGFRAGMPIQLAGSSVRVKDSAGTEQIAAVLFVSPTQVTYQVPSGTAPGAATVTIAGGDGAVSTGGALIHRVAPGLFTANGDGQGVAAAFVQRVRADGTSLDEPIARFDAEENRFVPLPLDLGPETDRVFLVLFGTGIRLRSSLSTVIATIGGVYAEVSFAGAHPDIVGVDQINVLLPRRLAGRGEVDVLLTVEAQMANAVRIRIQ